MPTLESENNQEHDLYVRALRSLDNAGVTSEHVAPAITTREQDFMHECNVAVSRRVFQPVYTSGQYEKIFKER